jgi:hypothetical protein
MSRIGTLYSVHGECAEGISEFAACGHAVLRERERLGMPAVIRAAHFPLDAVDAQ